MRERVTATRNARKCSSLKTGHRNRDLCPQLAIPTAQLAISALRAHTAVREDEDYDVLADGMIVGRIFEEGLVLRPPELRWGWSITIGVPSVATPGRCDGGLLLSRWIIYPTPTARPANATGRCSRHEAHLHHRM